MHDPRCLMNAVTGRDQGLLVAVHEARPALEHDHNVEFGLMTVPTCALLWCMVRLHELRNHLASGRACNA